MQLIVWTREFTQSAAFCHVPFSNKQFSSSSHKSPCLKNVRMGQIKVCNNPRLYFQAQYPLYHLLSFTPQIIYHHKLLVHHLFII